MKFKQLPDNPTNADLGEALKAIHECIEEGKVQATKNRRTLVKMIAANRTEAMGWVSDLETRVKRNEDGFAIWLKQDEQRGQQLTTLLQALGADKAKPHKPLMAMSQVNATWRIAGVMAAILLAAPVASKMVNAAWLAVTAVLLK
jgi:hypothetical protein